LKNTKIIKRRHLSEAFLFYTLIRTIDWFKLGQPHQKAVSDDLWLDCSSKGALVVSSNSAVSTSERTRKEVIVPSSYYNKLPFKL